MSPEDRNEWPLYANLVLSEIENLKQGQRRTDEQMILLRLDVASLKVRAGIWGATAGLVPALMTAAVVLVQGGP